MVSSLMGERDEPDEVGWLLPGAVRGVGGGPQRPKAAEVRCPETFVWQPAGSVCPDCDVLHSE
jgi:hypothetical protein